MQRCSLSRIFLCTYASEYGNAALHDALGASMGPGVLEIKCPFNRGQPDSASVPSLPPWYYMPQVMQPGLCCCTDGSKSDTVDVELVQG